MAISNSGGTSASDLPDAAVKLVEYGPIGLAVFMLLVVAFVLLLKELTPEKERTLKWAMTSSTLALVALLVSEFYLLKPMIHFVVNPYSMERFKHIPRPVITVNSRRLDEPYAYELTTETTAIIDVSETIDLIEYLQAANASKDRILAEYNSSHSNVLQILKTAGANIPSTGAHQPSNSTGAFGDFTYPMGPGGQGPLISEGGKFVPLRPQVSAIAGDVTAVIGELEKAEDAKQKTLRELEEQFELYKALYPNTGDPMTFEN